LVKPRNDRCQSPAFLSSREKLIMSAPSLTRRHLIAGASAAAVMLASRRGAGAQSPEDAAAQRAVEISELEAARDFDELYDLLHPDAQAFIPREVVVGWYADFLDDTAVEPLTVAGVEIIAWSWPVTGVTYPETAEVSYVQPFIQNGVRTEQAETVRLVDPGDGGGYRWFFGRSREFVDEQIARFAGQSSGGTGEYELIELGVLPGFDISTARVLNDNGVIVGDSSPFGEPGDCGFVWRDGEMAALHELTGQSDWINYARDINREGAIVGGSAPFEGNLTAYLVHGAAYTDLGHLPNRTSSSAEGINNAGVVVGWSASHYTQYETAFRPRAVIWRGNRIDLLEDDGAISSYAYAVNDDGLIAGTADWGAGNQAVLWSTDGIVPLPLLPSGQTAAYVTGINTDGTVVGYTFWDEPGTSGVPWSWQPGDSALTLLPLPTGITSARDLAINDEGQITGTGNSGSGSFGLLWRDGGVQRLDDLIDAGSDWTITAAADINNQNEICGQARSISNPRNSVAVLLRPRAGA
jgi:uncharacterized membrane protein